MKHSLILFIALFTSIMYAESENQGIKKELKHLEGTWKAVAMEAGGQALPKDALPPFMFIVSADGKAISKSAFGDYEAKIIVDVDKDPKTIDNLHKTGKEKGKKQLGVYKLEGDKWIVCMTMPGAEEKDRPKDFDTKGSLNAVIIFERQTKDKEE